MKLFQELPTEEGMYVYYGNIFTFGKREYCVFVVEKTKDDRMKFSTDRFYMMDSDFNTNRLMPKEKDLKGIFVKIDKSKGFVVIDVRDLEKQYVETFGKE